MYMNFSLKEVTIDLMIILLILGQTPDVIKVFISIDFSDIFNSGKTANIEEENLTICGMQL